MRAAAIDVELDQAKIPVTVIVPTKNEAANIRQCLLCLGPADQVFVVDSQSTDETVSIAKEFGVSVVQFFYDGGWPKKKNWAIHTLPIRNNWILIVDGDERIEDALWDEIATAISSNDFCGYYVRWKFYFLGRWMRHSWSHGWMLRLFRKELGAYEDLGMRGEGGWDNEVHENVVVTGKTARLKNYLVHDTRQDLNFWLEKQNQFSTWNAARRSRVTSDRNLFEDLIAMGSRDPKRARAGAKDVYLRLPFKPLLMFFYLYFWKRGILDGKAGYYFCAMRSAHELNTDAKVYERSIRGKL